MEKEIVLMDTSVLIDLFRRKNKEETYFFQLTKTYRKFCISAITEFEIYVGSNDKQKEYWNEILKEIPVLPFDGDAAKQAVIITKKLKMSHKQIEMPDLFIASTAMSNNLSVATLNKKHFVSIENLNLV